MHIEIFFLAIFVIILFLVFFRDLFPRCSCCKKVKPGFCFRIYKITRMGLGLGSVKAVCKKCIRKYGFDSLSEFEKAAEIKERLKRSIKL